MALVNNDDAVAAANLAQRVTALMLLLGATHAANKIGTSRLVLTTIAAGLPVRRASLLFVATQLPPLERQLALERTAAFCDASTRAVALRQRIAK